MANVKINGVTYSGVPSVQIPNSTGGGNTTFYDTSSATANASHILSGYIAYNASGSVTGNASVPSVSQDGTTKILTIA